jgi:hypothetical protein
LAARAFVRLSPSAFAPFARLAPFVRFSVGVAFRAPPDRLPDFAAASFAGAAAFAVAAAGFAATRGFVSRSAINRAT